MLSSSSLPSYQGTIKQAKNADLDPTLAHTQPSTSLKHLSIEKNGWLIDTYKGTIATCSEYDTVSKELSNGYYALPTMFFPHNSLHLSYKGDNAPVISINFCATDALKCIKWGGDDSDYHKLPCAESWMRSHLGEGASGSEHCLKIIKPFDWSYRPFGYAGTMELSTTDTSQIKRGFVKIEEDTEKWRSYKSRFHALLSDQSQPILFYDEMVFYEDELSDNGISKLVVKIRVMPTCFLVLMSFSVDMVDTDPAKDLGVGVPAGLKRMAQGNTRLFHEFGSGEIYRETDGDCTPDRSQKVYLEVLSIN